MNPGAARLAARRQEARVKAEGKKKLSKSRIACAIQRKAYSSGADHEYSKTRVSLKEHEVQSVRAILEEREAQRDSVTKILDKAKMAYA